MGVEPTSDRVNQTYRRDLALPERLEYFAGRIEEIRTAVSVLFPAPPQALGPIHEAMTEAAKALRSTEAIAELPTNDLTAALATWFEDYGRCNGSCDWTQCWPQIRAYLNEKLGQGGTEQGQRATSYTPADLLRCSGEPLVILCRSSEEAQQLGFYGLTIAGLLKRPIRFRVKAQPVETPDNNAEAAAFIAGRRAEREDIQQALGLDVDADIDYDFTRDVEPCERCYVPRGMHDTVEDHDYEAIKTFGCLTCNDDVLYSSDSFDQHRDHDHDPVYVPLPMLQKRTMRQGTGSQDNATLIFRRASSEFSEPFTITEITTMIEEPWAQTGGNLRQCRLIATTLALRGVHPKQTALSSAMPPPSDEDLSKPGFVQGVINGLRMAETDPSWSPDLTLVRRVLEAIAPQPSQAYVSDDDINKRCIAYGTRTEANRDADRQQNASHDFAQGAYWMRLMMQCARAPRFVDIDELRALRAAACPGKWEADFGEEGYEFGGELWQAPFSIDDPRPSFCPNGDTFDLTEEQREAVRADERFCAEAANRWNELLDNLERLQNAAMLMRRALGYAKKIPHEQLRRLMSHPADADEVIRGAMEFGS